MSLKKLFMHGPIGLVLPIFSLRRSSASQHAFRVRLVTRAKPFVLDQKAYAMHVRLRLTCIVAILAQVAQEVILVIMVSMVSTW